MENHLSCWLIKVIAIANLQLPDYYVSISKGQVIKSFKVAYQDITRCGFVSIS